MWLEAILSKDDFVALAAELLPLTINLGDPAAEGHYIRLVGPAAISLSADKGLRIACKAEVRWPLLGLEIPIHLDALAVALEPSIASSPEDEQLAFKIEVENVDVAWVPALVDRGILKAINEALHSKKAELNWAFAKTLSHVFALPVLLEPVHGLSLKVAWGKVRTTEEAVVFAISFHTHVIRDAERLPEAPEPSEPPERASRAIARHRQPTPGAVALGTALALVTGYMAFAGLYNLFSRPAYTRRRAW